MTDRELQNAYHAARQWAARWRIDIPVPHSMNHPDEIRGFVKWAIAEGFQP